ncbi:MAG: hypothetical protein HY769_07580 [Candidatus Stahlbacteria bacterium]|nr:hypothetical protein [Candidatus Stahlbacteria bacterium]
MRLIFYILSFFASCIWASVPERYHTYQEVVKELDSIATLYPNITYLDSIGISHTDSLPIWAIKISANPQIEEDEPAILYNGTHHAEELLGTEICMHMINDLVTRYGIDPKVTRWIDSLEIWIVPIVNPDGREIVTSGLDTIWRKNTHDNNHNGTFERDSDGVDLNRNYDFNWNDGDANPLSEYYRGDAPFSELETQAIRNLSLAQHFVFDVCYHSARTGIKEVIYYPWRWDMTFSPDHPTIKPIADSMAKLITNERATGSYAAIFGTIGDGGSARDWFYGTQGTISFTAEVCTCCILLGEAVDGLCQRNLVGAYFLLDRALGSGITGQIIDSLAGTPIEAEVRILEAYNDKISPRLSEPLFGRYHRILAPGVYTVEVSKSGYDTVKIDSVIVDSGAPTILNIKLLYVGVEESANPKSQIPNPKLEIYPNPFSFSTTITIPNSSRECGVPKKAGQSPILLEVYDLTGRLVKSFLLNPYPVSLGTGLTTILDVSDLEMGSYFIKLGGRDFIVPIKKIILIK